MPLPIELDHINLWLLEHAQGFVLVDTGFSFDASRAAWQQLENGILKERPLHLIVVTHYHPDHAGCARWLQERHGVPVWMSQPSETQMRQALSPLTEEDTAVRARFLASHGVDHLGQLTPDATGGRYTAVVSGMPEIARHPKDGEEITWGDNAWRCLEVHGHASGHLCLHSASLGTLISGDQILPTISPNVSLTGWGDDPNPLASYLHSLERLAQLDAGTIVLPSHGRPFAGLRKRASQLIEHHHENMARIQQACREPMTAYELLPVLYGRSLRGFHRFLALGEAIAHLEYLVSREQLGRRVDARGVIRFVAC